MKTSILTISLAFITLVAESEAKVRPASMITDNMVLQQNANGRIYGTADPGSTVTVTPSWDGKAYTTTTDRTGEWSLAVKTPAGSFTPYTITLSDGEPLTINNVLIGEVWLASGQSNMQMPLKGFPGCCTLGGYDEIASASDEAGKVRFFTVPLTQSYTPLDTVAASWTVPSPDTAPEYSALAWHFAKRMSDVLNVPVGIVSAAYGGAKVESWTPRDMLEKYPDVSLDPKDIEPIVHYHRPMLMYNAMFNPIKNYTYNGIIWYQGCSNVATYDTYAERLAAMVKRWRDDIGIGDIPFYA
ncbi:MAG: sialate O-acetylesterase, partial [Duncaniella sp.]|nr:sialate O-acetylesterase [Duncaniella sp.]